jgi:pyroglutamyl-peptidase
VVENPTQQLAQDLDGETVQGWRVVGAGLAVCFETIEEQIRTLMLRERPRAILLLGVAVGRNQVDIEGHAYNLREAQRPDASGRSFDTAEVLLSARTLGEAIQTPLDRKPLLDKLREQNLPSELSADPGRYLCNASFFHALHLNEMKSLGCPAVFVHLPQLGNPFGKNLKKTWTLEQLRLATTVIMSGIVSQLSISEPPALTG